MYEFLKTFFLSTDMAYLSDKIYTGVLIVIKRLDRYK